MSATRGRTGAFDGLGPGVFEWLAGLERDNSLEYVAATREGYDEVRGGLRAMLEELAREFGGAPRLARQTRDLRFRPGAPPYKTRAYGIIEGAGGASGGLYAELSAGGLYAGSGYYRMAPDQLARYRAAAAEEATGEALLAATGVACDAGLELGGERLRTAPRGVALDHPRIELLRWRSLIAGASLPGAAGIGRAAALGHVAGAWRAAGPLRAWLDAHVGPSELPPPEGRRR